MDKRTKLLAALAILAAQAGLPEPASAQGDRTRGMCDIYIRLDDRAQLQAELERLLEEDPDSPCIELILARLGEPLAQVPPEIY